MTSILHSYDNISYLENAILRDREYQRNRFLKVGSYGPSGSGKTLLVGALSQVESASPVLYIDIEGGSLTIEEWGFEVDKISLDVFGTDDRNPWLALLRIVEELEGLAKKKQLRWNTAVFDGFTAAQDFAEFSVRPHTHRRDVTASGWDEYKQIAAKMQSLIWRIKFLPLHTWVTAREKREETANSTKANRIYKNAPDLYPAIASEFVAAYDIILKHDRVQRGTNWHYGVLSRLDSKFDAKTRVKNFPSSLDCTNDPVRVAKFILDVVRKEEVINSQELEIQDEDAEGSGS